MVAKVPVLSGSVIVRFELVLGASRITVPVPDAFPLTVRLDMLCGPYQTMVQTSPVPMVTVTPELMVIGPALIAFLPLVIV